MKDLQVKLKQVYKDHVACKKLFNAEIASLKQQIADSEGTLRHGDYGVRGYDRFIYTSNGHQSDIAHFADGQTYCTSFTKKKYYKDFGGTIVYGNIFDDLIKKRENKK